MNYNYIINPITFQKIYTNSEKGRLLIQKYIYQKGGKKTKRYFSSGNNLTAQKQKYCRCILHVAKNNSKKCNENREWNSPKCYNPYTVCAASVKTTTGGRTCMYDFSSNDIPKNEIQAYIQLNRNKFGKCLKKKSRKNLIKCYNKFD